MPPTPPRKNHRPPQLEDHLVFTVNKLAGAGPLAHLRKFVVVVGAYQVRTARVQGCGFGDQV